MRASLPPRFLFGAVPLVLAAVALSLIEPAPPIHDPQTEAEPPSDWFGMQRAFPGQTVNQEAYLQALSWARVERSALTTSATGPVWTQAGPFNVGGRATALAVAPGGTIVYLGTAAGGVFKSTNAGVNWAPSFDQVLSIGAVALDPSNVSHVYVGTGESNAAIDNYDGAGLFHSTDAGASWSYLGLQETRRIARVAVDPANPNRILVAAMGSQFSTGANRGLYRSEDGGQTWSQRLFVNDSTGVCDVVFNPTHSETVYCASWERVRRATYRRTYGPGSGIWRSVDHGGTWTRLATGLPAPSDNVGRIALAVAPTRPSTVYAQIVGGIAQSHNGLGFFRSLDGGTTWTQRTASGFTGIFGGFGWYFGDMRVSPTNADEVYCLGQNLARSPDGGATFGVVTGNAHVDFHALWVDPANPARLFAGCDGGFWSTTNGGASWTRSQDLPTTQFYAGAIDASNPARLLGGAQDNGTNATNGAPASWFELNIGGDGFYCLVDPTNANIVFGEYQNMSGGSGPLRSTDGGASFSPGTGIVATDRFNWNAPFAMAPSDHNLMLAGSHRVYKSTNNGLSWTPISADLTTNNQVGNLAYSTITTLAVAPSNPNYFYAGTDDGRVWRTKNQSNWQMVTAGLPLRWVTRVSPDPLNPEVVYVTLSGYNQDDFAAHVYRSTNAGDSWTAIDGNLPDVPANDLLVDPLDTNRLYLATDLGVYTTRDLGGTWYPLGIGLPLVPVADLTLHAASRTLVAATHGRSQWKFDLTQLPVAVGDQPPAPKLALRGPSPNPSRGEVRFAMEVSRPGRVTAAIYDALGRHVITLLDGRSVGTRETLAWDGRDGRGARVRAGAYFLRVAHEDGAAVTRRLVRLD